MITLVVCWSTAVNDSLASYCWCLCVISMSVLHITPMAMIDCAKGQRKHFGLKSRIPRAVIGMGTNEWPSPLPEG